MDCLVNLDRVVLKVTHLTYGNNMHSYCVVVCYKVPFISFLYFGLYMQYMVALYQHHFLQRLTCSPVYNIQEFFIEIGACCCWQCLYFIGCYFRHIQIRGFMSRCRPHKLLGGWVYVFPKTIDAYVI